MEKRENVIKLLKTYHKRIEGRTKSNSISGVKILDNYQTSLNT